MTSVALLALLLACPAPSRAAARSPRAGTSGAEFLKLGADARGDAMGMAMTAASDGASSIYWNPAGLSQLERPEFTATFASMYQSVQYGFAAFAQPLESPIRPRHREYRPSGRGAIAAGIMYLNAGAIEERDNTGLATGGHFTPQDFAAMAGWGGTLTEDFDVGFALKYIQSRIQSTAQTTAADGGIRYRATLVEWPYVIALSAHNFGAPMRFHQQQDPLPATLRLGQSLRPLKGLVLDFDLAAPRDNGTYASFGAEGAIPVGGDSRLIVRGGWSGRTSSADLDGSTGATFGFGLKAFGFGMDYAWLPFGVLGRTHRLTFNCSFE